MIFLVGVGYVKCALSRVTLDLRIMLVALEERFFISGTLSCEHQSANHMHNSKDARGSHHQQVRTGFPPPHFVAARTSLSIISPKRIICGFSKNRGQSVCVCLAAQGGAEFLGETFVPFNNSHKVAAHVELPRFLIFWVRSHRHSSYRTQAGLKRVQRYL
jgi:hypothetical protein